MTVSRAGRGAAVMAARLSLRVCFVLLMVGCRGGKNPLAVDDDGDGFTEFAGDCDDSDPRTFPGVAQRDSPTACMTDHDGDGWGSDSPLQGVDPGTDCDDGNIDANPEDVDGDGHSACDGDCDDTRADLNLADVDGDGHSTCAGDCDDEDPELEPVDADGDGQSLCGGDCDDMDPMVDTLDRDGDGFTSCDGDCDDEDPLLTPADNDGDGFSSCTGDCHDGFPALHPEDGDGDGFSSCDGDCDDADPLLDPADRDGDGFSLCDGDCDDAAGGLTPEDGDGDGYSSCDQDCDDADASRGPADDDGDGFSTCQGDCDDSDPSAVPIDGDGDGYTSCTGDCDDSDPTLDPADVDGDGYSTCAGDCDDQDVSVETADLDGDGYSTCTGDCDDTLATVFPGAAALPGGEICPLTTDGWVDWTGRTGLPWPMAYAEAATDPAHDRVVVYGGTTYHSAATSLIALDLGTDAWEVLTPGGAEPGRRVGHGLEFDPATSKMVLFGGGDGYTLTNETFILDAGVQGAETWRMVANAGAAPDPRFGATTVLDKDGGRVFVLGGEGYHGLLHDVWAFDLASETWEEILPSGWEGTGRRGAMAAFDGGHDVVWVVGGLAPHSRGEPLCLVTATERWQPLTLTGAVLPPLVDAGAMWLEDYSGLLIHGGAVTYGLSVETFFLRATSACEAEVVLLESVGGPTDGSVGAAMAWDPVAGAALVLGGQAAYAIRAEVDQVIP